MNENLFKRNELLAEKTIKGLASRNMTGYYAATKEDALAQALSLIPEKSLVTMGGGMSVHEIGLVDALKAGAYDFLDRDEAEDKRAAMLAAYDADFYLASCNALTDDGILINIDGNANRVSAIAQEKYGKASTRTMTDEELADLAAHLADYLAEEAF